ncbi:MAG: hypothetical protein DI527_18150 [Chelatococcus sp.]|nr:MAG: hypothetical protein DI527_18150 [Chelatococcus sp.]
MLHQLLAQARDAQRERRAIPALADEMLVEAAARYAACRQFVPFRVGQLVTPRPDCAYKGAGDPHIVVEVLPMPKPAFAVAKPGNHEFGHMVDMRVLCYAEQTIASFWVESWAFEPWHKPKAAAPAEGVAS